MEPTDGWRRRGNVGKGGGRSGMRRMIVTLGVAAGVVLLAAPAALAKGNGTAFISGPGSGTGSSVNITIRGGLTDSSEPVFWQFGSDMGLFETKSQLKEGPG